jgi:Secretion system C-terminal sorting domain
MKQFSLFIILVLVAQTSAFSQGCLPDGIAFSSQAEIDSFQSTYPNCTEIEGDVFISGTDITNLQGLNSITAIGGSLSIYGNLLLENLVGLENIISIEGSLDIGNCPGSNPVLQSLTGLDNLVTIAETFSISNSPKLSKLFVSPKLKTIGGSLRIRSANCLKDLSGLDSLSSTGGLNITNTPLCSLHGLESLSEIDGELYLNWNDSLTSLNGLNNLSNIGQGFSLDSNDSLFSLNGLESLVEIGGGFSIASNNALTDLSALSNLTQIGNNFGIIENEKLINLNGLDSLSTVNGTFTILTNLSLINLNGLSALTTVNGDFGIANNPSLINLNGLSALTTIAEDFGISYNPSLTDLSGFENLSNMGGYFYLFSNDSLTSLAGIENIPAEAFLRIYIEHNDILSECDVQSVCDFLDLHYNYALIEGNAPGCNSRTEVVEACQYVNSPEFQSELKLDIYPNPAKETVFVSNNTGMAIQEICLFNQFGTRVKFENASSRIDVSSLNAGLYVMQIKLGDKFMFEKIMINN